MKPEKKERLRLHKVLQSHFMDERWVFFTLQLVINDVILGLDSLQSINCSASFRKVGLRPLHIMRDWSTFAHSRPRSSSSISDPWPSLWIATSLDLAYSRQWPGSIGDDFPSGDDCKVNFIWAALASSGSWMSMILTVRCKISPSEYHFQLPCGLMWS